MKSTTMIGELYQWNRRSNSGRVRPVDERGHPGFHVHRAQLGGARPDIGLRVSYVPWQSGSGERYAADIKVLTAEQAEVARCLG